MLKRMITLMTMTATALMAARGLPAEELMGLDDVVVHALEHNTMVLRQAIALDSAKRSADTAWNSFYPSINAQAAATKANTDGSYWAVSGSVSASLALSPALVKGMEVIRLAYAAGTISLDQAKRDIERSVRKLWNQLITIDAQIAVLESSAVIANTNLEQVRVQRAAGLANEIDLLNAQIKVEAARLNVNSAKTAHAQALASFRQLIGLDANSTTGFAFTPLTLPENLDALNSFDAQGRTTNTLRSLETGLRSARAQRTATFQQNFLPSLSLSWSWSPAASLVPDVDLASSDTWMDSGRFTAAIGMKLDPLIPGSAARTALAKADNTIADLELQMEATRENLSMELTKLLDSIAAARAALAANQSSLALAERSFALTREAWRAGTRDLLTLQNAEQTLSEARLQILTQTRTLLDYLLDLEYSSGLSFGSLKGMK